MKGIFARFDHWIWVVSKNYNLELHAAITAAWLGAQLLIFQPLSSGNPSMRGFILMNNVASFLPWKSDFTWGALLFVPAAIQIANIFNTARLKTRGLACIMLAMIFSFFALMLLLDNHRSTGIPMYSMLTVANIIVFVQLTKRRIIGISHEP